MLRACSFSDVRVVRLLNRRFVNFYFDMTDVGVATDPKARDFFRASVPEQHDIQETINPHIVFVAPDGEILGELHGYAHPDTALQQLRQVLARHPDYAKPAEGEVETESPEARSRVLIDLYELDAALRALAGSDSEEARYLRMHVARLQEDAKTVHELAPSFVEGPHALDARLESAWTFLHERRFDELANAVADFPADHPRGIEARYLVGLALYHQGDKREARDHWRRMIESCSLSPWVYRADWAHFCTTFQLTRLDEGQEVRRMDEFEHYTPLNRHGYGYRWHPDLELRPSPAPFDRPAASGEAAAGKPAGH